MSIHRSCSREENLPRTNEPTSLKDIDEINEWLMGEVIHDENGAKADLVFDDDTLTWGDVHRASGVELLKIH
uniref:Uncharacterized protein n=1 Tax=Nelumbo nucifera TaxID=4432 RepID=A0A822Z7B6_NELNU|nr:TPA_asm: hypothetical protein HUJ06_008049 [Nelumbo nucifera]